MATFVFKDGEQYGPYESDELDAYIAEGVFLLSDVCWQDGWPDWRPLSSITQQTGLPTTESAPPTISPQAPSNDSQRKKVQFSTEMGAFVGDLSAIVKLAARAVAESGFTLQNANDSIGMVSFQTGMTMGSFQGATCSITFIEIDDNTYRPQTAGKQNLGGAQLMAIDMGGANKLAQKVVSRMVELTGGNSKSISLTKESAGISQGLFIVLLLVALFAPLGGIIALFVGYRQYRSGNTSKGTALLAVGAVTLLIYVFIFISSLSSR